MKIIHVPIEHHLLLAKLYQETGIPLDRLPYTPQFEQLHAKFCACSKTAVSAQNLWEQLVSMRKKNQLTKIGRKQVNHKAVES